MDPQQLVYGCAPGIAWVKDADQTLLVEEGTGRSWSLRGEEAVLWDLASLGYTLDQIVDALAVMQGIGGQEAHAMLLSIVRAWAEAGIVRPAGGNGRG